MEKKLTIRSLSFLLCAIMIISMFPMNIIPVRASSGNNIENVLNQIMEVYPNGSYFSKDGKSCPHDTKSSCIRKDVECTNCQLKYIITSDKCKNLRMKINGKIDKYSYGNGWTCYALASFCFTQCFGKSYCKYNWTKIDSDKQSGITPKKFGSASNKTKYEFFKKASLGDIIQVYNWGPIYDENGNYIKHDYKTAHYMVFISCDSTGITVYDCNVGGNSSRTGKVRYGKIDYSGEYGCNWDNVDIEHANNYDIVANRASIPNLSTSMFEGGTKVSLKTPTSGATIYYTTNGNNPSTSSKKYTGAFDVTATQTIKAIAVKSGLTNSIVMSQTVTVNKTDAPVINEPVISENSSTVTIKDVKDTSIYYTLDGTDPYLGGIIRGAKYTGAIQLTENTIIKAIAVAKGKTVSNVSTKTVDISKPSSPTLTLTSSNSIGIGDEMNLSWTNTKNAYGYKLIVNGEKSNDVIKGCTTSIVAEKVGEYNIQVVAVNYVGESVASTPTVKVTVNPDVTVTFKDYDNKVIATEKIHYGKDASVPAPTSRKGYSFSKWNGKYTNVKEDSVVIAEYTANTYTITFVDEAGKTIGTPQSVDFGEAAVAPSAPEKTGYTFNSWSVKSGSDGTSYTCVDGNATFEPVYTWADADMPLAVSVKSAIRSAESYEVTTKVTNSTNKVIYGKIIAVIKTENDKVVAQAINQIQVPANAKEKEYSVNINSKNNAMLCEVYIVGNEDEICNDRTGGALAAKASCTVTKEDTTTYTYWSDWSEWSETPVTATASKEVETKTQYRYSDRDVKTSYETTMNGYSKVGNPVWIDQGNTEVLYVKEWPEGSTTQKGFKTDSDLYIKYDNSSKVKTSSNNTETYRYEKVSESVNSYLYWHWCTPKSNKTIGDRYGYDKDSGLTFTTFHAFESNTTVPYKYLFVKTDNCPNNNYWAGGGDCGDDFGINKNLPVYKYVYKTYRAQYTFEKWSNWSAWSDTSVNAVANSRKVETRTLYRYRTLETAQNTTSNAYVAQEDLNGTSYSINGKLNVENNYSGKTAFVLVYKGKNSDATESQLEYIGQVKLGAENSYSLSFIPKEEITEETGDYIVSFSIATATRLVNYVDVISAPKPIYKVEFKDLNGIVINTQNVEQGKSAVAPNLPEVDGHNVKWNKTFTNITADTVISAQKEAKTYNVIFVDYENDKIIDIQEVKYGEKASFPADPSADGVTFTGWNLDKDSIITETTVVKAEYTPVMINVNFLNKDGSVFETRKVAYGMSADVPENVPTAEGYEFVAWDSSTAWWNVKKEVSIKPIFIFDKTVETPVVSEKTLNIGTGVLDVQTSTENAVIRYTTDGTEPTEEDLILEDVVFVEETTEFRIRAFSAEMNPSDTVEVTIEVIPESDIPAISALGDISQYEIGTDYAKLCMKIENPNEYPLISYGYYITDEETGETNTYENSAVEGMTDKVLGKVFTVNNLEEGREYSYDFFAKYDINGEEYYMDTTPTEIGAFENRFTTLDSSPDPIIDATIKIKTPSKTTIDYGYTLILSASAENLPEGSRIAWKSEGSAFTCNEANGKYNAKATGSGTTTIKAIVVDANGSPIMNSENKEISETITLTSNAGFFKKLIAFFKNLFGSNMTIDS